MFPMSYRNISTFVRLCRLNNTSTRRLSSSKKNVAVDSSTKKKESLHPTSKSKEESPAWLLKLAPTKGGLDPPTRLESAILGTVFILGYYAWFVDPGSWLVKSEVSQKKAETSLKADN
eukprot:245637_1